MTVTNIKNRLDRLETANDGHQRVVVIFPEQTDEEAFAKAGVSGGGDIRVVRVNFVASAA